MGLSKITIVNLRTITFSESFFTYSLRRSQPVGMWRLSTKHSRAMKSGRFLFNQVKAPTAKCDDFYGYEIFTSVVPCFFNTAYFQFFSNSGKFFPARTLRQLSRQSSSLLSYWSGVQIPDGAPLPIIPCRFIFFHKWGNGRPAHYNIGPSTMVGNSNGQRTACKAGACRFDSDLYLQQIIKDLGIVEILFLI